MKVNINLETISNQLGQLFIGMNTLGQRVDRLAGEIVELRSEVKDLRAEVKELHRRVDVIFEQVGDLTVQVTEMREEIADIRWELNNKASKEDIVIIQSMFGRQDRRILALEKASVN